MIGGRAVATVVVAAVVVAGCGDDTRSRGDVLADLADEVIAPAYERFAGDAAELAVATTALCASPTAADLATARDRLSEARAAWSYTEAMWVGPVMERRSWALIDWPPASDEIEALVADTDVPLDEERLTQRIGADQRGLGAVEYLIGGDRDDPADVLERLGDTRRCDYLTGVAAVIEREAARLSLDWIDDFDGTGPYLEAFGSDGERLDALINDALFLLEGMADLELGAALGEMGAEADPDAIVEGPAGLGVADLASHLDGLRIVLVGDASATGLRPLLGDDLSERLSAGFDRARDAVVALDSPLRGEVEDDPGSVRDLRSAIKAIQVTVATEVVSRLGVTIGFSDADGDTGA